jgi:hypothetical protein
MAMKTQPTTLPFHFSNRCGSRRTGKKSQYGLALTSAIRSRDSKAGGLAHARDMRRRTRVMGEIMRLCPARNA